MNYQIKNKKNLCKFELPKDFQHLAIIMDGNGRWAQKKGWSRYFGHFRGVRAFRKIVKKCSRLGVPYLTVFAFSTENWKRSSVEVSVIMKLMSQVLSKYKKGAQELQIRLRVLGDLNRLPSEVRDLFQNMEEETKEHQGLQLIVAVNYGGQSEIIQGIQALVSEVQKGHLKVEDISPESFSPYLSSYSFPPPDLIIRTGGVNRLSNFYLWNAVYSEFYVSPVLWPDFDEKELLRALESYSRTERRFGAIPK